MNARHVIRLCLTSLFLMLLAVRASGAEQSPPEPERSAPSFEDELRALRTAVTAEQARIDELRADLDRRVSSLADMRGRLDALVPAPRVEAAFVQNVAAEPAKTPRFEFYGDSTFRFEHLRQDYDGCETCTVRIKGRLRLRFGVEGRLAPGLRVVTGLGIGELNDANTIYQTLGGYLERKVTTWDRAFLSYRPERASWMDLTVGKFPYTWLRSSMTYDVDFYPEGLSEKFSFDLKQVGPLKNITAHALQLVVNEQPAGPDTLIVGGQAGATIGLGPRVSTRLTVAAMDLKQPDAILRAQLAGTHVGVRNTNAISTVNGLPSYVSQFRYVNAIVENSIHTPSAKWPATIAVEYQRNLRAASDRDTGLSFRVDAGRQQKTGDWNASWHFFQLEQDAIISALGESDWRAPSNVIQHRVGLIRTIHPNVFASFTLYRGRTLDANLPGALLAPSLPPGRRDPWSNRMYFDVIYRY